MDIVEKFKIYLENTPKEEILADIKHAKRYDNPNSDKILRKNLITKWELDHHYKHARIEFEKKQSYPIPKRPLKQKIRGFFMSYLNFSLSL